jgi:regulatory protein
LSSSRRANATPLKARALRLLARREHSRAELERKLAPHAESPEALQSLLLELQQKKQLSDERYAELRAHCLSRKYGVAKIRQDLRAHGVAADLVSQISFEDQLQKAKAILARKYREAASTREEKARRARFLQSRGFSYEIIRRLVSATEE